MLKEQNNDPILSKLNEILYRLDKIERKIDRLDDPIIDDYCPEHDIISTSGT